MRTGLLAKALFLQLLLAFSGSQVWAAPCVAPPASAELMDQFKANPQSIMPPGSDTRTVESAVRDLAATDATLAKDLALLAQTAPHRFRTAVAAGLAQAAVACSTVNQEAGLLIQQAVAGVEDAEFQASFAAVAGDISTAATEAALASAASSVGSVVVTYPNTSPGATKTPGGGGGLSLVQITVGVVNGGTSSPTTSTTTAASPVSATR
jgi:hypothetical protein